MKKLGVALAIVIVTVLPMVAAALVFQDIVWCDLLAMVCVIMWICAAGHLTDWEQVKNGKGNRL